MATKAEVRNRAAEILGVLPIGQDLDSQDDTRISAAYDEAYARLKEDGVAVWASTGTVPAKVVPVVAALVAFTCMNSYGVSNDRYTRIVNITGVDGELAVSKIRRLVTPFYESQTEAYDY